jgi:hypothetical protein
MRRKSLLTYIGLGLTLVVALLVSPVEAQDNGPSGQGSHAAGAAPQAPLGTAFTYQGFLTASGSAATGQFDFQFRLFDAATGGSQVGGDKLANDVQVRKGVFTVRLDYGPDDIDGTVFFGDARWIEVAVRPGSSSGSYTVLSPRQELTATPYAFSLYPDANVRGDVPGGNAVYGINTAGGGESYGLRGDSASTSGRGVSGRASASSGATYGLHGESVSPAGYGVYGIHTANSGITPGVAGISNSTASNAFAVLGQVNPTSVGSYSTGVRGISKGTGNTGIGVWGSQDGGGWGVYGSTVSGYGVIGQTTSSSAGAGVYGTGVTGVYGIGTRGVEGRSSSGGISSYGVYGESTTSSGTGVRGQANNGSSAYGIWGISSSGYAGWFEGKVRVTGNLQKGGGSFIIDHPLDPENKYLYHSFVESPDMMNIYNGNVTLDSKGEAWVELPAWFGALNRDFRYQLTAIGAPGPNLFIATPVDNNRFQIAGGQAGAQVSWQVTGIRQDPYANLHRIPVEEDKPASEQGTYLHPDAYGQSESQGINYQRMQQAEQSGAEAAPAAAQ